jgi:alpha-mannosidase
MIRGVPGHHPAITRERLDKALNPLYLRDADTNLCDIRYSASCPVSIGHLPVLPTHSRPLFKDVVPAAMESNLFVPIEIGHTFGPSWSTHWLRVDFEIPEPWHGTESTVHFRFDSNCEAMLYSADGQPLQGFTGGDKDSYRGNRRAEFDLKALAFCCRTATVFIEVACNGLFGCGGGSMISAPEERRTFSLAQCDLALLSKEGDGLFWDFVVLRDLVEHAPKGSFMGERALVVANELLNAVKNKQPSTFPLCRKQAAFVLSLLTTHVACSSSQAEVPPVVHAVGHCHIDTAWLWPFAETRRKVARSWITQLQYSKFVNPAYSFTASQMVQYDWLWSDHPESLPLLQAGIRAGTFVPVGASWVEPDVNVPSGESLIRQFLHGAQVESALLGESLVAAEISRARCSGTSVRPRIPHGQGVFWLPDTFGYNAQLPQIMRGCGLPFFLTQKLSWSLLNKVRCDHGGTRSLYHIPPHTFAAGAQYLLVARIGRVRCVGAFSTCR